MLACYSNWGEILMKTPLLGCALSSHAKLHPGYVSSLSQSGCGHEQHCIIKAAKPSRCVKSKYSFEKKPLENNKSMQKCNFQVIFRSEYAACRFKPKQASQPMVHVQRTPAMGLNLHKEWSDWKVTHNSYTMWPGYLLKHNILRCYK